MFWIYTGHIEYRTIIHGDRKQTECERMHFGLCFPFKIVSVGSFALCALAHSHTQTIRSLLHTYTRASRSAASYMLVGYQSFALRVRVVVLVYFGFERTALPKQSHIVRTEHKQNALSISQQQNVRLRYT